MSYIDTKYINLISSYLENFKQLSGSNKFNFRCYYCGDSEKNKKKSRGYLIPSDKDDSYYYYCHNCGISKQFKYVLKDIDSGLYQEYLREQLKPDSFKIDEHILETNTEIHSDLLYQLPTINDLCDPHFAREYVKSRKIPKKWYSVLRYTDNFKEFVNSIIPDKFSHTSKKDSRLIIPFHDYDGKLTGFQGRALYKTDLRYYTIMLEEDSKKIFGLDVVNTDQSYYVCEGPIDAMCLGDCFAVTGSDIKGGLAVLSNTSNATVILDNQPRNKEVCKQYSKCIDTGVKVFIWPDNITSKDINDAIVKEGFTSKELRAIIDENSFSGLVAKVKFSLWKRI